MTNQKKKDVTADVNFSKTNSAESATKSRTQKVSSTRTGKCQTIVFSRICGYYSPHVEWNPGKGLDGELGERKHYKIGGEDEKKTGGDNISRS